MRGIGTDGASTMIGCHNGVVKRLKSIAPSLIGVHRAAHPLNLASAQAGDKVSHVKKFSLSFVNCLIIFITVLFEQLV